MTDALGIIGLAMGALMGGYALINPAWASGVVRLVASPDKPGGYAEFRATYGGLFLFAHGVALLLLLVDAEAGHLACAPLAAGWLGAGIGRTLSLAMDRDELREAALNPIWIGTELALGLLIGAPVIAAL